MFWVRAMVAIAAAVVVVAAVVVGVVAFAAAAGGRSVCCVCQSDWFEWIAAWVLLPDWLGLIAICAKSSEERLLSECHGDSCEKFGCRREHLQPIKCGDAHAAHLQTQMEILQGLALPLPDSRLGVSLTSPPSENEVHSWYVRRAYQASRRHIIALLNRLFALD